MGIRGFQWVLIVLGFVWISGTVRAQGPSANATLSSATTAVGEPVELQVEIQGVANLNPPPITVNGLDVQCTGYSPQVQLDSSLRMTKRVTLIYTILPQRSGTFTLPALQLEAGGKTVSTRPLTLTVSGQSSTNGPPQGGAQANPDDPQAAPQAGNNQAFAEWIFPKTTAYVGEAVPTELRVFIPSNITWGLESVSNINGDGYTVATIKQSPYSKITKGGREYDLAVIKTAITPVKTGTLTLPATDVNILVEVPMKRSARPRMPRGFPDIPDILDESLSGALRQRQRVTIRTNPLPLEIKPLPAGKPQSFTGAIGQFTLSTKAAPQRVHAGDPITVTMEVSGIGNFDRIGAPVLADEPGWKSYPPSGKFQPNDEVGISGVKTFEMAVMSETARTALPKVLFSYFDPGQEKYVTLTDGPLPVTIEGSVAPSPTPAAPVTAASSPTSTPSAAPVPPKLNDIQFIRIDPGQWGGSLQPAWQTRLFWLIQLIPLTALLALGGWLWYQNRIGDLRARRLAALAQGKAEALRVLQRHDATPEEFYDAAMRTIQFETALATQQDPATIDAEMACASRALDPQTETAIKSLFAAHDELRYAGAGGGSTGEALPLERRESVRQLLEEFEKRHA